MAELTNDEKIKVELKALRALERAVSEMLEYTWEDESDEDAAGTMSMVRDRMSQLQSVRELILL